MKYLIGKKIDMTQIWDGDQVVAVTRVEAGPCVVTQIKQAEKDGYLAVQVGFGKRKAKNINKPQKGHFGALGDFQYTREFRADNSEGLAKGCVIKADTFVKGDVVKVVGTSKGKGFQGVVKRHGFSGSKMTHGNKDQQRMPGSIGAAGPAHVFKGTKMGGRTGGERVTVTNQEIAGIDLENNLLLIKGNVPGARNSLVLIQAEGELKFSAAETKAPEVSEELKTKKVAPVDPAPEATAEPEDIEEVVEEAKEKVSQKKD